MKKTLQSILLMAIALAILLMVFQLYTQPDFLVQLSNQIWACF